MVKVIHVKQHLIKHSILSITSIYKNGLIHSCQTWLLGIQFFLMSPKLSQRSSSDGSIIADGKCFVNYTEI